MKQLGRRQLRFIALMSVLGSLLVACATSNEPPPIGAGPSGPVSYPVDFDMTTLNFPGQIEAQTHDGLEIHLGISSNKPQLYYRYQITSRVNGTYIALMLNPPKVYLVYRIPFYKNTPDKVVVKVELTNDSTRIIDMTHAVCVFDIDGQTVLTQPLKTGDLLPGHTLAMPVEGPDLSQLKGHKELAVWIYQLGSTETQGNGAIFKWTLPYALEVESRSGEATLVDQSPLESGVSQYEGKIEPANPDAASLPQGQ
ncbi:MAG TPA: hypothetical protein VFX23_10625 [Limnobacter sp.]|uniref:hypothetical protein n=1 Tax=Limnobacter sp. TaxID=2003368 RepID=UPI002E3806F8|nr:hypothetical protein [Limnobacter sp.]HEX5486437.1 hypothetical protein [Limnobacter sp.]